MKQLALLLALAGCGGTQTTKPETEAAPDSDSDSDPDAVFGPLEVGADWQGYRKVNAASFRSPTHGGRMVDVYVSEPGADAYLAGDEVEIPVGTVIVKTSTEPGGEPGPIFVMERRQDDWWYAIHWADPPAKWRSKLGGPVYWRSPSPRVEYCSDCHDGYQRGLGGLSQ